MQQVLKNGTRVEWNGKEGRNITLLKTARGLGLKLTILGSRVRHKESGAVVQEIIGPDAQTYELSAGLELAYTQEVFIVESKREVYCNFWQNELGFFVHPRFLTFLDEGPYEDGLDNWV